MLEKLKALIAPPSFADPERAHTATILNALIWFFFGTLILAATVGLAFIYTATLSSVMFIIGLAAILFISLAVMRSGHPRAASAIMVAAMWIVFSILALLSGGIISVNLVFLLSTSIAAGLLLGMGKATISAFLSSAFVLALAVLDIRGIPIAHPFPAPPLSRWLQFSFAMAMTLIVLGISLKSRKQALQRARQELEIREKAEEALCQSQKMESIGRLAGGIAHDFNNLLTGIMGNLELALLASPPETLAARIIEARKAGERAAELTRQLLTYSRRQLIEPEILDLRELISSLSGFLSRILGENISLSVRSAAGVGTVLADRSQVEHALLNLAANARDAMPSGGSLDFSLSEEAVQKGRRPDVKAGAFVRIAVTDTGVGMTKEVMANIFEPFYTTKGRGKGTGLGLAMVLGAMAQNGGFVEVESSPGKGSSFSLYLPRVDGPAAPTKEWSVEPSIPPGTESVVIVEDEPTVRAVILDVLRGAGYRTTAFASAEEAFAGLDGIPEADLLVTDVVLPGSDGHAVARAFQEAMPSLRVLLISGYPDDAISERGVLQKGLNFLPKPFSPRSLAVKVRSVLDGRPDPLNPPAR